MNLSDNEKFEIYSKRVLGCFENIDLFPDIDIEDALASLRIISEGKSKKRFFASQLFTTLAKQSLDFSKEIPPQIRQLIVFYE